MRVLVTGGAGYIGGVVTAMLVEEGHTVTVLDDLSTGHADAVHPDAHFVRGTVRERAAGILQEGFDAVLHFAAKSVVPESVTHPGLYWSGNVGTSLALLEAMRAAGTGRLVFSSTAAVYGEPESVPITEDAPVRPTNPYGATKAAIDAALTEHARMHGIAAVSLRYFNVAGAYQGLGERHTVETHLIPNVLRVALGERESVSVFGEDYPTPDGTCVRDYIHVADLARAHLLALGRARAGRHDVLNLGNGAGFSVREVVEVCREVTGHEIPAVASPRRPGDPAVLVASSERAAGVLGWRPERSSLHGIVADAWAFHRDRDRAGAAVE